MKRDPLKPRRDFLEHLLLELEFRGRMLLASPERRQEMLRLMRMLRTNREIGRYALKRYHEHALFRTVLLERPLSAFSRVEDAIWRHFKLFAPEFKSNGPLSADQRRGRKAYDLARRGRPSAALRELDALIAVLADRPADDQIALQLRANAHLFAGAVGYMIRDEVAVTYYTEACELASYKIAPLLVLGAILVRLGRTEAARTAWNRALQAERESVERTERDTRTLGQYEALQDAKAELRKLEEMVASLDGPRAVEGASHSA